MSRRLGLWGAVGLVLLAAHVTFASFHAMEIEQVLAGVIGNTTVQVIQLRMRSAGQNLVSNARLVARDAAGNNPIIVRDFTTNVGNSAAGSRILVATGNLPSFTTPPLTPDFTILNPIPASYLAAGTLTFESDGGIVYWRLSWGGAGYTGPGTGDPTNDPDGNFNPPYPGPLPSCTTQALQFRFGVVASTSNANDYQLTPGAAVLTRNSTTPPTSATVTGPAPATGACCSGPTCSVTSSCSCGQSGGTYQGNGTVCTPSTCITDCNGNGIDDAQDIAGGTSADCAFNTIPDECDIAAGTSADCTFNTIPDECDIAAGTIADCNVNTIPDTCDIAAGTVIDCNVNGVPDECDLRGSSTPGQSYPIFINEPQSIPDCDGVTDRPIQSIHNVSPIDLPCQPLDDLDVDLQIQHTYVGDLVVTLKSPSGQTVSLMHRVGVFNPNPCSTGGGGPFGNGNDDVFVVLDDQASQAIEGQLGPINTGQGYRPGGGLGESIHLGNLAAFSGELACGPWTLTIQDDAPVDQGFLMVWSLHFNYSGTSTPPFSRDCNFNRVPDECDVVGGTAFDTNRNNVPDECEPGCCNLERHGDWDGDCDMDLLDYSALQICGGRHSGGRGTSTCFTDGCNIMDCNYDSLIDVDDILCVLDAFAGPVTPIPGCDPNAGGCDAWATPSSPGLPFGGTFTVFGSPAAVPNPSYYDNPNPPIPADFFGPGSLPFEGIIILGGQAESGYNFGNTDTIIEHPPLRFGFGDLPLCDIVPARLESLSLRSRDPIVVQSGGAGDCNGNGLPDATDIAGGTSVDQNANGVPDECEWYVAVEQSAVPAPDGSIDACKTHENGGTFNATIYVQPLFVFVNKAELDSGTPPSSDSVKFLDTGVQPAPLPPIIFEFFDRPFSVCPPDLGVYVTPCSEGNFVPGIDTSPPRGAPAGTTCNSHITPGSAHYFCPPECFEHLCTYPAAGAAFGACFDADGVAPFCADAPVCPAAPVAFVMPGELCDGPDPVPCPDIGYFDVTINDPGTCAGPDCLALTTCVQTYGPPISCTDTGIPTGDCP